MLTIEDFLDKPLDSGSLLLSVCIPYWNEASYSVKENKNNGIIGSYDCNTPVLTPFTLNAYDVYIVINRSVELKEKIPTMDYHFYVSAIKSVPMVFCASQPRYDF